MNYEKDGLIGFDSDGVFTYVTRPIGTGYRQHRSKKINARQGAELVKNRIVGARQGRIARCRLAAKKSGKSVQQTKEAVAKAHQSNNVDAMMESWLRLLFWKLGKASADTAIAVTAAWAATSLKPEQFGILREGLLQEHQTWTPCVNEALMTELLEHISELDASALVADRKFSALPFELSKQIQAELRRSNKLVLETDHQPLDDDNTWTIEEAFVAKEPGPEEQLLRQESQIAELIEAASLGPQERELMQAFLNNPDLFDYGGNKDLAEILQCSTQQVAVVKKRALNKMRLVTRQQVA